MNVVSFLCSHPLLADVVVAGNTSSDSRMERNTVDLLRALRYGNMLTWC